MQQKVQIGLAKQEVLSISTKAQVWYMDFAIALLLFIFTLVVYFSYTTNFQKQEKGDLDAMLKDAGAISSSLVLSGYPNDWDNTTVIRIGIASEHKVNATKLRYFKDINYTITKKKFGTVYDYFIFFVNNKGEVLNIKGICGIGNQLITTTYNIKSAYYYSDEADSFLKDFMSETFNADVYFGGQLEELVSNLSKYGLLVMEHPLMSTSVYNNYKDKLENYTFNGGFFLISGELVAAQDRDLVGVTFKKKTGQSSSQRAAIVNYADYYLSFNAGDTMVFDQYYYVENLSAIDFKMIATFNQTNDKAIARWMYGNGTIYFFSDFDVSYFSGNFINIIEDLAKGLVEGTCNPINMTSISKNKLVKTERYLTYNSKVIKMVVYVWQ